MMRFLPYALRRLLHRPQHLRRPPEDIVVSIYDQHEHERRHRKIDRRWLERDDDQDDHA
jgi:hypothetical protein